MLSYSWKRARLSLKRKRNKVEFELKKEQIESLKRLEDGGYLDLYFGDESHFGLTPGKQKKIQYYYLLQKESS